MILRGPHQEKKTKPVLDERKMKLAKSIFGGKEGWFGGISTLYFGDWVLGLF